MKTKKLFYAILTSALLMSSASSFCQNFSAGARLGVDFGSYSNFSKLRSDIVDNGEPTVKRNIHAGFQAGFMGVYSFNNHFGIQAEMIFDRKGEKFTVTAPTNPGSFKGVYTISVTYLTIPILFRGGAAIGNFKIHGILGPYIGFGLGGRDKGTSNMNDIMPAYDNAVSFDKEPKGDDDSYHMNRLDFGLTIGVEPAYKIGPGDIFLDLRYNYGFLDTKNVYEKGDNYYTRCNRSFGLSFGYMITFGKK